MGTMENVILVLTWFIFMVVIIGVVISSLSINELCIKDSSEWINKLYRNLTIIAMVAYTLTSIGDFVQLLVFDSTLIAVQLKYIRGVLLVVKDVIYFLGNTVFYILILFRVSQPLQLNKYIYYTILLLIGIAAIASICYCISVFMFCLAPDIFASYLSDYVTPIHYTISVTDFVLNVALLIIFTRKLTTLVHSITVDSDAAVNNVHLITNVVIKHSILFGIATIMNQSFILSESILPQGLIFSVIIYSLRAVENITNVLVLWLVLRINYDKYICICRYCHVCTGKCCMKNKNVSLENPYVSLQDL
eukprot:312321_1